MLALEALQGLSRLADLRLGWAEDPHDVVSAEMLASAHHLTRLQMARHYLDAAALADKPQLQHLDLWGAITPDAHWASRLLAQLQDVQRLTHLGVRDCFHSFADDLGTPTPAAAFSALTASSQLQHLDISDNVLPAGV